MEGRNIIEQPLSRHPHFVEWLGWRVGLWFELVAIQYAVIDKWRSKLGRDLDGMYGRFQIEVAAWNARYRDCRPVVDKGELAEAMGLYTLMVIDVRLPRPTDQAEPRPRGREKRRRRAWAPTPRPAEAAIMTSLTI
ncbi:hypothetical protein CO659_25540 [Rhizobium sp. S9]|uniref:hypothetical protein n=1 Tax=unclassified Rhizobium TaxID=2613769 RepID=UPI000A20FC27|nr:MULTISPECIES: hypothetical protein [unclassified Rhizobium]ARO23699.1 hypothetical protein TAL182_CH01921 [Rhizobium sp. TAL182]PDS95094.1 hypothetical protein CO659_25540 [Rhizobium sp. S9]